jgi:ABC-type Fe3+-siderophore transport system permease subunit
VSGAAWRMAALLAVLVVVAVVSLGVGAESIPPGEVVSILLWPDDSAHQRAHVIIVWEARVQRVLLAILVGAGLGAAGAGYQGLFRNPLADPFVIGASSGAALGATIALTAGFTAVWLGISLVSLSALLGAMAAVAVVYAIASWGNQLPAVGLLLAGAAVASFVGALVTLLMVLNDDQIMAVLAWLMGSLAGRGWPAVWASGPLIVWGTVGLWLLARPLDALTFGILARRADDAAAAGRGGDVQPGDSGSRIGRRHHRLCGLGWAACSPAAGRTPARVAGAGQCAAGSFTAPLGRRRCPHRRGPHGTARRHFHGAIRWSVLLVPIA